MDKEELIKILIETAKRVSKENGKCDNLIYTRNGIIREPELRDILSRVLSEKGISYGIEVPTKAKEKYGFSGSGKRAARIDLSVYETKESNKPKIHIELKADYNIGIAKDFEKLMREEIDGVCFFQGLFREYVNKETLECAKKRYKEDYIQAKRKCSYQKYRIIPKWFLLFLFIVKGKDIEKEYYYKIFPDISSINPDDFVNTEYEEGDLK